MIATTHRSPDADATAVILSQNTLFDLIDAETKRLALESPKAGFRHEHVERSYMSFPHGFDNVEVTVHGPCSLALDLESNRPTEDWSKPVQCRVGVFRQRRHEVAEKLEDCVFTARFDAQGNAWWEGPGGTAYQPDTVCDFAFHLLQKHVAFAVQR
jgi:hypothetical protein